MKKLSSNLQRWILIDLTLESWLVATLLSYCGFKVKFVVKVKVKVTLLK